MIAGGAGTYNYPIASPKYKIQRIPLCGSERILFTYFDSSNNDST